MKGLALAAVVGVGLYLATRRGVSIQAQLLDGQGLPANRLLPSQIYTLRIEVGSHEDAVDLFTYAVEGGSSPFWFTPSYHSIRAGTPYVRELTTPPTSSSGYLYAEVYRSNTDDRLGYIATAYEVSSE